MNCNDVVTVCSWCKKIRDPLGEWVTLEAFCPKHFEAACTHTICEDCRANIILTFH